MMRRTILVTMLAITATGCPDEPDPKSVELFAITGAPPASLAKVTNNETDDIYRIELSVGVAIAARCWDSCDSTCASAKLTVGEDRLFGVRPVYRQNGGKSEFALIAKQPGTTTLHVETPCAARDYQVFISGR
jgi:hypothetical protein